MIGGDAAGGRRALIVGHPHSREALEAARALAEAGWIVGVGSRSRLTLASASRACRAWHRVTSPADDPEGFLGDVARAVTQGHYDVVFGAGDPELLALSWGRNRIGTRVAHGPHDDVVSAVDKWSLHRAAETVGLRTPHTVLATPQAAMRWQGPAMVKTRLQWRPGPARDVWTSARYVAEPASLPAVVAAVGARGGDAVLQSPVVGHLEAVTVLRGADGQIRSWLHQRAWRTHPDTVGISVAAETIPPDPRLADGIRALLTELEWVGLAQLQFIVTPGDHGVQHHLIDLNGRFYGSLALARAAGQNLPAAWAGLVCGQPVDPLPAAQVGTRYVWLEGEIRRLLSGVVGPRELVAAGAEVRGATHSIIDRHDLGPLIRYPLLLLDAQRERLQGRLRRGLLRDRSATGHLGRAA